MIKTNVTKDSDSVFVIYKGMPFEQIAINVIIDDFLIKKDTIKVNAIYKNVDDLVVGGNQYEIPASGINIVKAKDFDDVTTYIEKWLIANHSDFVGGTVE